MPSLIILNDLFDIAFHIQLHLCTACGKCSVPDDIPAYDNHLIHFVVRDAGYSDRALLP